MFTRSISLLALGAIALTTAQAQGVGNAAAAKACVGFAPGSIKCLTDVSYVICLGTGYEVEQWVAPGTYCEQGFPYQRIDALVKGAATTTRIYPQNPPASTYTPAGASSAASSSLSVSSPLSAPPSSSASSSTTPTTTATATSNSVSVYSGSVTVTNTGTTG